MTISTLYQLITNMTFKTAQAYILCALLVGGISQSNENATRNCEKSEFINHMCMQSFNTNMVLGLFWSYGEDPNCTLQILSPKIPLKPSNEDPLLSTVSDAAITTPSASAICSTIGANISVIIMLSYQEAVDNNTIWGMLSDNYNNKNFNVTCRIGTEMNFKSQCDSVEQPLEDVMNCREYYQWDPVRCGYRIYELHRKPNTPGSTFPNPTSSASTSVTTPKSSSILTISSTNTYSVSTTSYPGSSKMSTFPLGLGLGLGIPLIIAIIIIIVLSIQLSLSKREKGSKPDAYSTISPNSGNSSPNGATQEPQLSANYSSISPNSTINKSTFNRKTLYAPASTYDQPYGNGNGNYASIPPSNGNTPSSQQKQTAPSVLYAIVNKVKPKRNASKASRTLANPNDDVVIVDNDLYTSDSVVSK